VDHRAPRCPAVTRSKDDIATKRKEGAAMREEAATGKKESRRRAKTSRPERRGRDEERKGRDRKEGIATKSENVATGKKESRREGRSRDGERRPRDHAGKGPDEDAEGPDVRERAARYRGISASRRTSAARLSSMLEREGSFEVGVRQRVRVGAIEVSVVHAVTRGRAFVEEHGEDESLAVRAQA